MRIVDNFNLGPSLVRGFAPSGIGPRDIGSGNPQGNPLGGTVYYGASVEMQFPIYGMPRDIGLKGAIFADAGTLYGFNGRTNFSPTGVCSGGPYVFPFTQSNCITVGGNSSSIRTAAGASIIWASPLGPDKVRLRQGHHQEPIRSNPVLPFQWWHHFLTNARPARYARLAANACRAEADESGMSRSGNLFPPASRSLSDSITFMFLDGFNPKTS